MRKRGELQVPVEWSEKEISMNYVDFFPTETCCDFFTIRLFHSDFFIFSVLKFAIFRLKVLPFRSRPIGEKISTISDTFSHCNFSLVFFFFYFFSLFYDHIIAFSLMVFPTNIQCIYRYLVCHWWRDTPLNTNCAHFFPFEMTQTVSRLWNSNEITSHLYSYTIKSICLSLKLSSKKNEKTVNSQFHFV